MPDLKIYTVRDLQDWLDKGIPTEGLDEQVIAPQRAWAIAHNPYVKEEDAVVAAIYEGCELAAFTACFPDMVEDKRVWWFSTLSCRPESAGKGYGLIMIGALSEAHDGEDSFDANGADETVEIFKYLGLKDTITPIYAFSFPNRRRGVRYVLTNLKALYTQCVSKRNVIRIAKKNRSNAHYTLRYINHVNDSLYQFISTHRGNDLFLRKKEMFNWIIEYPFLTQGILNNRAIDNREFGSIERVYITWNVEVRVDDKLVGFYMLRLRGKELAVRYLYYEKEAQKEVYASIIDHIIAKRPTKFITSDRNLAAFVKQCGIFPKIATGGRSFSYPQWCNYTSQHTLQAGDGDMFV